MGLFVWAKGAKNVAKGAKKGRKGPNRTKIRKNTIWQNTLEFRYLL